MPWTIIQDHGDCEGWAVVKDSDDSVEGCHGTEQEAQDQLAALNISEQERLKTRGQSLADRLNSALEGKITDEMGRADIIANMASAGGIEPSTVNQILNNEINCPPLDRLSGFASALGISESSLVSAAESDGCEYGTEERARTLFDRFWQGVKELLPGHKKEERAVSLSRLHESIWHRLLEGDRDMGQDNYLIDLYTDETELYALTTDRGKLYRYPVAVQGDDVVLGERVQVMEAHPPVTETRTVVRQQEDGQWRWFSVSGTAALNRSGEIDSRDLFDSFVEYAEETGEYPFRTFYHQDEAYKVGQADFLARDGFCYLTSGLYDDTPLAHAEIRARLKEPDYWGDSIGFKPTQPPEFMQIDRDVSIPYYVKGINKEISTVPEQEAAHLLTRTEVTRMSLQGKAWEAFVKLWDGDEEKARQWLDENPEARNRAIEQSGMITRNGDDEESLETLKALFKEDKDKALEWLEQKTRSEPEPAGGDIEIDDSVIEAVTRSVLQADEVKALADKLTQAEAALVERTKEVEQLTGVVNDLIKRLETLEKGESAIQQQIVDDTPAKFQNKSRLVYRPREANSNGSGDEIEPASAKVKKVLPKGAY